MNCLDSLLLAIAAFLLEPQTGRDMEDDARRRKMRYAAMQSAYNCVQQEMKEKELYIDTTITCIVEMDSSVTPPKYTDLECDTIIKLRKRSNTAIGVTKGGE